MKEVENIKSEIINVTKLRFQCFVFADGLKKYA